MPKLLMILKKTPFLYWQNEENSPHIPIKNENSPIPLLGMGELDELIIHCEDPTKRFDPDGDINLNNLAVIRFEHGIRKLSKFLHGNTVAIKKLTIDNVNFNGPRCVTALLHLCEIISPHVIEIKEKVTVTERATYGFSSFEEAFSDSDIERLSLLSRRNIHVILPDGQIIVPTFRDDTYINSRQLYLNSIFKPAKLKEDNGATPKKLIAQLKPLIHFFPTVIVPPLLARDTLLAFFNTVYQQGLDYTCGATTLRLIWNYYATISNRKFCHAPINPIFKKSFNEEALAKAIGTTWQLGVDIDEIAAQLNAWELHYVMNTQSIKDEQQRKNLLQTFDFILDQGIPIVINYFLPKENEGHWGIMIGIRGDEVILADPGARYSGKVRFECINKDVFIKDWHSKDEGIFGRFIIIFPNIESFTAAKTQFATYVPENLRNESLKIGYSHS